MGSPGMAQVVALTVKSIARPRRRSADIGTRPQGPASLTRPRPNLICQPAVVDLVSIACRVDGAGPVQMVRMRTARIGSVHPTWDHLTRICGARSCNAAWPFGLRSWQASAPRRLPQKFASDLAAWIWPSMAQDLRPCLESADKMCVGGSGRASQFRKLSM
jgi:hypothetical protein